MSTSTADSWRTGRRPVDLGSSFVRALKAQTGTGPPQARNKMPTKDFYYFKYKFKPESIDETKPGVLEPKPGTENVFRLEHGSTQGDGHVFNGVEQPPNGWECVLIYDEETGAYTLEKLDSTWDLSYDRSEKGFRRSPNLGNETPPSPVVDFQSGIRQDVREEEEEEEENLEQIAFKETEKPVAAPPPRKSQSGKNSKPKKQSAAASRGPKEQVQVPKSPVKGKGKPPVPVQLAFPAGSKGKPSPILNIPPAPAPVQLAYDGSTDGGEVFPSDGEDEEDMEPVDMLGVAEEDQGQEVDADAFARELEDIMDEEEDDSAMYRIEETSIRNTGGPVSLNAYAGGQYNDYSSSSDESEG